MANNIRYVVKKNEQEVKYLSFEPSGQMYWSNYPKEFEFKADAQKWADDLKGIVVTLWG